MKRLGAPALVPGVPGVGCALAARSASELRKGAATIAPPRPRRKVLRLRGKLRCFFMVCSSRSFAGPYSEGIRLAELGEQVEDAVAALRELGVELIDHALVVAVRRPAKCV